MKSIKINWSLVDEKINIDILKVCQAKTEKRKQQTAAAKVLTFGK
jgi:hypothetical protein